MGVAFAPAGLVVAPNPALFANWVSATVKHFRGKVDRYSIWNEPNLCVWLRPQSSARRCPGAARLYRDIYVRAYAAVKRADPRAQVLIGETSPYASLPGLPPLAWLRQVAPRGARLVADGYAHHPYEFTHSPRYRFPGGDNVTIGTLSRLTATLNRLAAQRALRTPRGRPLDVYLTEFGYYHVGPRAIPVNRRIAWLKDAFTIAGRNGRVREMLQYMLFPLVRNPRGRSWDTSMLTQRPIGGLTRYFTEFRKWTDGALRSGLLARPR